VAYASDRHEIVKLFHRNGTWFRTAFAFLATFAVSGGGGHTGPARVPLEGVVSSVQIAGKFNGSIAVLPECEAKGPAANGLIKAGVYQFTEANGPVSGTDHVLIDVEQCEAGWKIRLSRLCCKGSLNSTLMYPPKVRPYRTLN